jgi:hypothetical protein
MKAINPIMQSRTRYYLSRNPGNVTMLKPIMQYLKVAGLQGREKEGRLFPVTVRRCDQ